MTVAQNRIFPKRRCEWEDFLIICWHTLLQWEWGQNIIPIRSNLLLLQNTPWALFIRSMFDLLSAGFNECFFIWWRSVILVVVSSTAWAASRAVSCRSGSIHYVVRGGSVCLLDLHRVTEGQHFEEWHQIMTLQQEAIFIPISIQTLNHKMLFL